MAGNDKKKAVIFFADVIGASEISNNRSVEDYDKVVSQFHKKAILLKEIFFEDYNGEDVEFSARGDEICLIIHSEDSEEDIRRAVRYAFYLKLAWLGTDYNHERVTCQLDPREIAIGIHHGLIIFRAHPFDENFRDGKASSEGYAINLAKRVEGQARAGKTSRIFLSEAAHSLFPEAKRGFPFDEPRQFELKGLGNKYLYEIILPQKDEKDDTKYGTILDFILKGADYLNEALETIKQKQERIEPYIVWATQHEMDRWATLFTSLISEEGKEFILERFADPWAYNSAGLEAYEKKKYDEAIRYFNKSVNIDPKFYGGFNNWGVALDEKAGLISEAEPEEAKRLFDEAISKYEKAVKIKKDYHEAFDNWGIALYGKARLISGAVPEEAKRLFDEAISKYEKAVEIDKDYHLPFNNWGIALSGKARLISGARPEEAKRLFDEAISKYEKAVEIKKDYHEAFDNWGSALSGKALLISGAAPKEAKRLFDEAISKYGRAVEIKKDYHEAFKNWGSALIWLYHLTGDKLKLHEALKIARKAEGIMENAGIYNIACCHALLGEKKEAFEALRKAVAADPKLKRYAREEDEDWKNYRADPAFQEIVRE